MLRSRGLGSQFKLDAFLHDYGALVAPTAAIVNGFIAVVVAQFFKDHPIAKVILVVAAFLLGAAAIGATFYSQHQIVADRLAAEQRHKEIKEQLGVFISGGLELMADCGDNTKPPPMKEADAWYHRLNKFLEEQLGHSYVVRLANPAGVPAGVACQGADKEHNDLWRILYAVNFHLEQFSQEANF